MTLLHAFLLGIIEGITEFLPISSTGHLIVSSRLLGIEPSEYLTTFIIAIQLGAILAVLTLYGGQLLTQRGLWSRLAVAFAPTAVLGLAFYPLIRSLLDGTDVVLKALAIGGVLMIVFERWYREPADAGEDLSQMPHRSAFLIGLAQSAAMVPGVSRAAATVCGGLMLGLSRRAIIEFSFLLAIPTMAAATGLDVLKNTDLLLSVSPWPLVVGFVTSWIVAMIAIRWLLSFVRAHDFTAFGVYRILIALALWFVL
jgi:undecaprenyl-diphosphatase